MTLFNDLKQSIQGTILSDPASLGIYSVDASIYEVMPTAVVLPKNINDIRFAVKIAAKHHIPITPRGAATGITGGCLGSGIILDLSLHLNRILEINLEQEYALCEPGVVQDRLNDALRTNGYRLGPDTSTGNRATLGGMLANNAAGARSLKYGRMIDHVLEVEMILATGEIITFGPNTPVQHPIVQKILQMCNQNKEEIKKRFPSIPRRVSGYNLDALLGDGIPNLCPLIVGSEGTLGVVTKIKVAIAPLPKQTSLSVIHFDDMIEGLSEVPRLLSFNPISLEMIDRNILEAGQTSPALKDKLDWLHGNPAMVLVAEFEGDPDQALEKPIGYAQTILKDPKIQEHVWLVRKAGLGLLLSKRSYSRAIAFIEDISVDPQNIAEFMQEFLAYLEKKGKRAGIYGHAGSGCLHIRPYIDLRDPKERQTMKQIQEHVADLVMQYGGTLSGEHGDGLVRSWLTSKLYGENIYSLFKQVKEIFDPNHLMNPGKIVRAPPFLQNLRKTPVKSLDTFLDFSKEGGIELSADLCNGNAQCRKKEGTMCPSFQATGREYDSTRARAQTLRGILHGSLSADGLASKELYHVLDLCLQCKGCKSECPSQVDMAKMKTEFLHHFHKKHGLTLRDRIFGHIGTINQISSHFPRLFNAIGKTRPAKKMIETLGITSQRELPELALKRFSKWFSKHPKIGGRKILLFNDTFNEFNCPEVGIAAVKVLEKLGYQIISPPWTCCGRTLISKGMLDSAKVQAEKLIATLLPYAKENIPIIGLEPSCLLTIKDDFQGLLGYENPDLKIVNAMSQTFDQFIASHHKLPFQNTKDSVKLHGHCHQKALTGTSSAMKILHTLGNPSEIPSGCCGMAGSFGYEKEHYQISMAIGELKLFPAVRQTEDPIIADGFSCRCQIAHATGKTPLHLAQYLANLKYV
ncbi:FAD-binding and (Fe-S)-binding domain-containing protein [Waddlia chondrophila]|uniref:FAD linked oxidase domain-containing protein n=1 Tax=Waddlia chondrophila (strain ATCC VR-1470 / WSU 86-1044) TaxID=716544 RepID=D6YVN3_WADCW|nr:FAD-binding and (Fe-S)-binding domain-containing protein [Waddlia chondrophila]ADI38194.1 FAD linked oxidase domain-containing protein [Waddlia chondrophila WSU 86-1044]